MLSESDNASREAATFENSSSDVSQAESPAKSNNLSASVGRWDRYVADGSLLLTSILWGINIPVVKVATHGMPPLVFNASRMVLSTMTLAVLAWLEWKLVKQPDAKLSRSRLVVFALASGLAYPLLFMFGIDRTTAGNTALLLASMPMWTAILSAFFIRERLPLLTWTALCITFVGTAIVLFSRGNVDLSSSDYFKGNLLILVSALTWATATVISGPLLKQITPLQMAFWAALITTPIHLLIVARDLPSTLPRFAEPVNLGCLIYSGIFSTGIAYATWHVGVRRLGGSHASVYQNVVTLVAVSAGWIVLSEPLLVPQIVGGILMIVGLLAMRFSRR